MNTATDVKSPTVVGVQFDCAGQDRKEFIQEWVSGIRFELPVTDVRLDYNEQNKSGEGLAEMILGYEMFLKSPDYDLLEISMECGGHAVYHRGENIPLVDVPCPCGDPNHWLIKWIELEESDS